MGSQLHKFYNSAGALAKKPAESQLQPGLAAPQSNLPHGFWRVYLGGQDAG